MPVNIISPAGSTLGGSSVVFEWNSPTDRNCNLSQIQIFDASGATLVDSGRFSPGRGNNSVFTATGLPEDGSALTVDLVCRRGEDGTYNYTAFTAGNGGGGGTGTGDPVNVSVTVVLDATELETMLSTLLTDFDQELFSFIISGMFMAMAIGLGGGWLYKAVKSRW